MRIHEFVSRAFVRVWALNALTAQNGDLFRPGQFFPEAIAWARDLEARRSGPRSPGLVFTTHSWLVSLYLDCPSRFPAPPVDPAGPGPKGKLHRVDPKFAS